MQAALASGAASTMPQRRPSTARATAASTKAQARPEATATTGRTTPPRPPSPDTKITDIRRRQERPEFSFRTRIEISPPGRGRLDRRETMQPQIRAT